VSGSHPRDPSENLASAHLEVSPVGFGERVSANTAKTAARETVDNPGLRLLARVGYVASGILHALIGLLAIAVARGSASTEADQSGALAQVARTPGGVFILWVLVIGLAALGLWLVVSAFLTRPGDPKKKVSHFVNNFAKGIVYLVLSLTALVFALGGSTSSDTSTSDFSARAMSAPGGVFAVAAAGAAIFCVGVYFLVKGIGRKFKKDIAVPRGAAGTAVVVLGIFGYVAKGVALGVVGVLFVVAAATSDPSKADGLDGGLKTLASLPFGAVILIVIGVGLIAYGVYSVVRARFAHL
jgi:Domain of Unknown Function (DUF1206)